MALEKLTALRETGEWCSLAEPLNPSEQMMSLVSQVAGFVWPLAPVQNKGAANHLLLLCSRLIFLSWT